MKYLLDTNGCIRYLNRRSENLIRRLESMSPDDVAISAITRAERLFGARKSAYTDDVLSKLRTFLEPFSSLPFDDVAADHYGRVRAVLERQGRPIGPNDLLIASIALAHDLVLVTHNVDEFSRVVGLTVEDWEVED